MKIEDIYKKLDETLDRPLPYKQTGSGRYLIDINDQDKLIVNIRTANIDGYYLLTILFRDPNSDQTQLTHAFNTPGAVRVFSTIISIIQSIPNIDIVVFIPDDIEIDISNKKVKLYKTIMNKLYREHKLISTGQIESVQYGVIPNSPANRLTDDELAVLFKKFAASKNT